MTSRIEAGFYDREAVRVILEPLLVCLRTLPEPDRANGVNAAEIFQSHLDRFQDPDSDHASLIGGINYGLFGRGLGDMAWSPEARQLFHPLLKPTFSALENLKPIRSLTPREQAISDVIGRRVEEAQASARLKRHRS